MVIFTYISWCRYAIHGSYWSHYLSGFFCNIWGGFTGLTHLSIKTQTGMFHWLVNRDPYNGSFEVVSLYPIGSMGLVYLPTFTIKKTTIHVAKYTIRGAKHPAALPLVCSDVAAKPWFSGQRRCPLCNTALPFSSGHSRTNQNLWPHKVNLVILLVTFFVMVI